MMIMEMLLTLRDPAYWIQCFCAAVFCYTVLSYQEKKPERWYRVVGKLGFLVAVFTAIHCGMSLLTFRYHLLAGIGTWLSYAGGVIIYAFLFSRWSRNARMVTGAVTISIIITVFELSAVVGALLGGWLGIDSLYTKALASAGLVIVGMGLSRCRIWKYYLSIHGVVLNLVACLSSSACVMVYDLFAVHVFPRGGDWQVLSLMSVILLALLIIDMVCYLMTYHMSREYTRVQDLTAENQMNKSAISLLAVTEENLAELRKIQHDIDNQYAYMQVMLDQGDYTGLGSYFEELTSTFADPLVPILDCGNHTMNLIFHIESTKARKAGIPMELKAAIPHELPFSQLDLVKLYTNILDNAIEACEAEKIPDSVIHVEMKVAGGYLFTRIQNPTTKTQAFLDAGARTTKVDSRIHGKGMTIARSILRKYDSSIRYRITQGEFVVEFMLRLKEIGND